MDDSLDVWLSQLDDKMILNKDNNKLITTSANTATNTSTTVVRPAVTTAALPVTKNTETNDSCSFQFDDDDIDFGELDKSMQAILGVKPLPTLTAPVKDSPMEQSMDFVWDDEVDLILSQVKLPN